MTPTPTSPQATPIVSSQRFGKIFKLIVVAALVAIFGNWAAKKAQQEMIRGEANRTTAALVPEITLSCGGEKEYPRLPSVRSIVLILNQTGAQCSTAWLRRPKNATNLNSDPEGDVKMQMAVGEGKTTPWLDDSPLIHRFEGRSLNAVRYQNLGEEPVKILLTIYY
ncbi:MAG: hypothetical protein HY434_02620 [Candidatus Liptonbacteria bacterium]|nr:hypothetical protein [Candidatus Liptonbacteria bacterium]